MYLVLYYIHNTSLPSPHLSQDRRIVVRESSGELREATWEERDRMMQVYFPSLGRKMWLPHMLTVEGLLPVLEAERYWDILDMACLQCDPGSADYIRVSSGCLAGLPLLRFLLEYNIGNSRDRLRW